MSKSALTAEILGLWNLYAPEASFMDFILNFSDWSAINWGIDTRTLNNEQLFTLIGEYSRTLKKY